MIVMTGSSKSIIEKSSEDEFEKLLHCCSDYAHYQRRMKSTQLINTQIDHLNNPKTADLKVYSNFLTLLTNPNSISSITNHKQNGVEFHESTKSPEMNEYDSSSLDSSNINNTRKNSIFDHEFQAIENHLKNVYIDFDPHQVNKMISHEKKFIRTMNDLNTTMDSITNGSNIKTLSNTATSTEATVGRRRSSSIGYGYGSQKQLTNEHELIDSDTLSATLADTLAATLAHIKQKRAKSKAPSTWIPNTNTHPHAAKSSVQFQQRAVMDARKCYREGRK